MEDEDNTGPKSPFGEEWDGRTREGVGSGIREVGFSAIDTWTEGQPV